VKRGRILALFLAVLASRTGYATEQLYRYRDADGGWHFTDRPAEGGVEAEVLTRDAEGLVPRLVLERADDAAGAALHLLNELQCPAEVVIELVERENLADSVAPAMHWVVPARADERIIVPPADPSVPVDFRYRYAYVLGDPNATHQPPPTGYRAPFALARSFTITQGFHGAATHASPANVYAVDIGMPIGTGVYAARAGVVVEIAYSNYAGGTDPELDGPRANIVRVLHEDGTFGLYAHLDRSSVRVRPGERVSEGQYIADSGNTGFTTGPHLHFAVLRNRGFELVSVPFQFRGPSDTLTEPRQGEALTAYP
jgi:murein DD-endopeptidase MepM/ murein hydrolase activator NlpD